MWRRCSRAEIWLFVGLTLAVSVVAEEYKLQYKVVDLRQEGLVTSEQWLYPRARSGEKLSAEPKYQSRMPLYFVLKLGNDEDNAYTMVLDESEATGGGYDVLYVDRNNNGDLSDDPKITGRIESNGEYATTWDFGAAEVMVKYGDRTAPYCVAVECYAYKAAGPPMDESSLPSVELHVRTNGYYTGFVSLGGSNRRIAVVDFNSNGLFNDYFKVPSLWTSGDRLLANGDQILIDTDGDGRLEGRYPGEKELYPYARYVQVDGRWYSLDIAAHGAKVEVETAQPRLGTIEISARKGSYSVQLAPAGGVLKLVPTDQTIQVPADTYRLFRYTAEAKNSSGNWCYDARAAKSEKKFEVVENAILPLRLGPPLFVNVSYRTQDAQADQPKAGDTIVLRLNVTGGRGERCSIEKNGERPPPPTFKVVNETGKTVLSGDFEYG